MLGLAGTILADTFFVSDRLGPDGLAALNIAICIFGLINGLGLLFGIGGATCFSILKARKEDEKADEIFTISLYMAAGTGFILWLAGMCFSRQIVTALGAKGIILPMSDIYMKTILCFAPFFIIRHIYVSFIRNDGNPRLAMSAMLIGSVANIILDYLFIYPMNMGIFGAALATGLTPVISIVICSPHLIRRKNNFHLIKTKPTFSKIGRICSFGIAAFINEFSSGIVLLIFNLLILKYSGNMGVAAYGIIANLALIVMAVYTGISQGVQPLLSRAYGEGKMEEVNKVFRHSMIVSFISGGIVVAGTYRFAPMLVAIFNNEHHARLQSIAESGLKIYFLSFLFLGCNFMLSALFCATERTGYAFVVSFFRGCIGIIVLAVLFSVLWGLTGIWISVPAVEVAALVMGVIFYEKQKKKSPMVFEP